VGDARAIELVLELAHEALGVDRERAAEPEVVFETGFLSAAAEHLKERGAERTERVADAGEATQAARDDDAYLGAPLELGEARAFERGQQVLPEFGRRTAHAFATDRRAHPAIAIDGHVDVEATQAVGERGQRGELVVALREWRKERRKAGAELTSKSRVITLG